jgi:hypothetical protein
MFVARCKVQGVPQFIQLFAIVASTDWASCTVPATSGSAPPNFRLLIHGVLRHLGTQVCARCNHWSARRHIWPTFLQSFLFLFWSLVFSGRLIASKRLWRVLCTRISHSNNAEFGALDIYPLFSLHRQLAVIEYFVSTSCLRNQFLFSSEEVQIRSPDWLFVTSTALSVCYGITTSWAAGCSLFLRLIICGTHPFVPDDVLNCLDAF